MEVLEAAHLVELATAVVEGLELVELEAVEYLATTITSGLVVAGLVVRELRLEILVLVALLVELVELLLAQSGVSGGKFINSLLIPC